MFSKELIKTYDLIGEKGVFKINNDIYFGRVYEENGDYKLKDSDRDKIKGITLDKRLMKQRKVYVSKRV